MATAYPSNLTNEEWELIKDLFNPRDNRGKKSDYNRKDIVDAIMYIVKTGVQWQYLPKDFNIPYKTVYDYYNQWVRYGVIDKALDRLNQIVRKKMGKKRKTISRHH